MLFLIRCLPRLRQSMTCFLMLMLYGDRAELITVVSSVSTSSGGSLTVRYLWLPRGTCAVVAELRLLEDRLHRRR